VNQGISLLVYPVKEDIAKAKTLYRALLGTDPYVEAGFVLDQDTRDVGGGMLIARVKDADGNTVGLRQA
jgi:hypothetical protein